MAGAVTTCAYTSSAPKMCESNSPILTGYIAGWLDKLEVDFKDLELGSAVTRGADVKDTLLTLPKRHASTSAFPQASALELFRTLCAGK